MKKLVELPSELFSGISLGDVTLLSTRFDRSKNIIDDEVEVDEIETGVDTKKDRLSSRFKTKGDEVDLSEIEDIADYKRWLKAQKRREIERRRFHCPF